MAEKKWSAIEVYEDLGEKKRRFADWLATPEPLREIKTQVKLAEKLDTSVQSLSEWKYKKPFINIVQDRKREVIGVDGLNKVLDSLMVRASKTKDKTRDANDAAELFLNWYYNQDFTKGTKINNVNSNADEELRQRIKDSLAGNES